MADAYRGLTIRIGGDTTKLTAALRAAQRASQQTQAELRKVDKAARFDPDSISAGTLKMRLMEERAEDLASQLKVTNTAYEQLGNTVPEGADKTVRQLSEETDNAALAAQRALDRYNKVDGELENMYVAINKAAQASDEFDEKFDLRKADDIEKAVHDMVEMGVVTQDDADKLSYLRATWQEAFNGNEAAKAVQTFRELEVKAEGLNAELKSTHTELSQLKAPSALSSSFEDTRRAVARIDSQIKLLEDDARRADEALRIDPTNTAAAQRKMADLAKAAELASEKARLLGDEMEAYEAAGVRDIAKGMGDTATEAQKANEAYAEAAEALSRAKAELEDLKATQQRLTDSTDDVGEEWERNAAEIARATDEVQQLEAAERRANENRDAANMADEYSRLSSELEAAKTQAQGFGQRMQEAGDKGRGALESIGGFGMALTATVTPALQQVGDFAIGSATDIDSAYRDMRKTVQGTEGDFQKLKQAAIDFSNQNVTSADQILEIQAIGGELGIAVENLEAFSTVVSNLEIATDLDTESAAEGLGHLSNIMHLTSDDMVSFGDSLVRLGNNGASTETDIMEVATRIGSMASIVGMSTPDVLALASSIASTGQKSEAAGTAIANTMSDIETAVANGGDSLQAFAETANMSAEDFADTWNSDPTAALKAFIEGLNQIEQGGGSADAALSELGITGTRQKQAIMGLMQTIGGLNDNLAMSNDAWNGVADQWGAVGDAANEAKAKNEGLSGSLDRINNVAKNMSSELGGAVAPIISDLADKAADLGKAFGETDDGFKRGVASAGLFAAALGPGLTVTTGMFKGLGKLTDRLKSGKNAWDNMTSGVKAAATVLGVAEDSTEAVKLATEGLTTAQKLSAAATNVGSMALTGLKGVAIGVAVAGIALLVSKLMEAKQEQELMADATESAADIIADAEGSVRGVGDSLEDASGDANSFLQGMKDLVDQTRDSFTEVATSSAQLDGYLSTISELGNRGLPLTAAQQERLKDAVKGYNDITGESLEVTDQQTGKLSQNTDEVTKNAQAWKDKARAEAYSQSATEYYKKEAEASLKLSQAQEDLAAANKKVSDAQKAVQKASGNINSPEYQKAASALLEATTAAKDAETTVKKYSDAEDTAAENADYLAIKSAILGSTLDQSIKDQLTSLPQEMQETGYNIASNLSQGITDGKVSVDDAMNFISSSTDILADLPASQQETGSAIAQQLAAGISSGNVSVQDASSLLSQLVNLNLSGLGDLGQTYGSNLAQQLATAVSNGTMDVDTASSFMQEAASAPASELPGIYQKYGVEMPAGMASMIKANADKPAKEAKKMADGAKDAASADTESKGKDFASGFASGISKGVGGVLAAAKSMTAQALATVQETQKSGSPSRITKGFGHDFGDGYTIGIRQRAKQVAGAASYLTSRALDAARIDSLGADLAGAATEQRAVKLSEPDIARLQVALAASDGSAAIVARLDSIERNLGPIISASAPVVTMTDRQQARYIESLGFTR